MPSVIGRGVAVEVDPVDGGRITSLWAHGREWLAPSGQRPQIESFVEAGTGGWDDIVPTVEACRLPDGTQLRDHGDVWRQAWTVISTTASRLVMRTDLTSLPVIIERRIEESPSGLRLSWMASTTSVDPIPLLWSAHPLFAAPPGTRLETGVQVLTSEHPCRGTPVATPDGIDSIGAGQTLKAFASGEACATVAHPDGRGIRFTWDPAQLPHLGLYWDRDAFTDTPVVAIEPTTGPSDSAARALAALPTLSWERALTWWIEVSVVG